MSGEDFIDLKEKTIHNDGVDNGQFLRLNGHFVFVSPDIKEGLKINVI